MGVRRSRTKWTRLGLGGRRSLWVFSQIEDGCLPIRGIVSSPPVARSPAGHSTPRRSAATVSLPLTDESPRFEQLTAPAEA